MSNVSPAQAEKYCECGDHLYDYLIYCPFCQGIKISDTDLLHYVLGKHGLNYAELRQEYIENIYTKADNSIKETE